MSAESRDFWSRRRAAAAAEEAALEAEAREAEAAEARAALEDKTDAEILAELDLPDPDSLQPGDPVSGFMSQAVPDRIRRRALRKLWALNPALANLDGLLDYGGDFTDAATVVENLQTTYQVGKGMLAHIEALAAKAEEAAAEEATPDNVAEAPAPEPDEEMADASDAAPASTTKVVTDSSFDQTVELQPETPPAPRRMTFTFETESS